MAVSCQRSLSFSDATRAARKASIRVVLRSETRVRPGIRTGTAPGTTPGSDPDHGRFKVNDPLGSEAAPWRIVAGVDAVGAAPVIFVLMCQLLVWPLVDCGSVGQALLKRDVRFRFKDAGGGPINLPEAVELRTPERLLDGLVASVPVFDEEPRTIFGLIRLCVLSYSILVRFELVWTT